MSLQEFSEEIPNGSNPVSKTWMITLNNPTEEEKRSMKAFECNRRVIGEEVGEQGTPHLQCVYVFKKAMTFKGLKKLMPRANLQKCKSLTHAWNYCIKEGNFDIVDNRTQGKRNDLEQFAEKIKAGQTDKELATAHPVAYMKFHKGKDALRAALNTKPPRTEMTSCVYVWGPSGYGKSTVVKNEEGITPESFIEYDGKYWSDYHGTDAVVLDDIDLHDIKRSMFLKMINHVPWKVRVLGAYKEWTTQLVVIIANTPPNEWRLLKDAACRRISQVWEFTALGEYETKSIDEYDFSNLDREFY